MTSRKESNVLPTNDREEFFKTLKERFEQHMHRHVGLEWTMIQEKLLAHPEKIWSLFEMERTGGEPDVVGMDKTNGVYIFFDCSPESPVGRRSVCYDEEALAARKKNKPAHSACGMALDMGIELLDETQYRYLQSLESVDQKTSSWIKTPTEIRKLKGALFCDFRYKTTFVYHNGVESYYAARGFRGSLRV